MATRVHTARGASLSIDHLCEAVNGIDPTSRAAMFVALQEMFPEVIWARHGEGRISAAIQEGYK